MESETSATVVEKINNSQDTSRIRSCSNKQKQEKIPKRIRKAEREKEKREQLNELFLGLADTLEITDLREQNNGKASILRETIRLLKDLFNQIESLKKDSASLLTETHYVTMEKNEMVEENCVLKTQIEKLADEIKARVTQYGPNLMNVASHLEFAQPEKITKFSGENLQLCTTESAVQQGHAVFVVPLSAHHNVFEQTPKPKSTITKPLPRYPTQMDSWPLQLLAEQSTSN